MSAQTSTSNGTGNFDLLGEVSGRQKIPGEEEEGEEREEEEEEGAEGRGRRGGCCSAYPGCEEWGQATGGTQQRYRHLSHSVAHTYRCRHHCRLCISYCPSDDPIICSNLQPPQHGLSNQPLG